MQPLVPAHRAPPTPIAPHPANGAGARAATAWLHIHACTPSAVGVSRVRRFWQQVRALGAASSPNGSGRLDVEIHDLGGGRVLTIDDAAPTIALSLPAGTYHVVALQCGCRRQFTVALRPGSVVDLHLHSQPDPARG